MTATEKAKELVDKYNLLQAGFYKDQDASYGYAKQCAIIAVDEVINGNFAEGYDHNFWAQVKTEINTL